MGVLVACSDDGTVGAGETGGGTAPTSSGEADTASASATSPGSTDGSASTDPSGTSDNGSDSGGISTGVDGTDGTGTAGGSSSGTGDGSGGSSSTGGEGEFIPCYPEGGEDCPGNMVCHTSLCCFGQGFCVPPDTQMDCGGILGTPCRGQNEVCVTDACGNDVFGVCVRMDFYDDEVCMEQMNCWYGCAL
jgi:hypothetical protein